MNERPITGVTAGFVPMWRVGRKVGRTIYVDDALVGDGAQRDAAAVPTIGGVAPSRDDGARARARS